MKFKITSPIIEPTEGSPHQLTQTHASRFTSFKTSSPLNTCSTTSLHASLPLIAPIVIRFITLFLSELLCHPLDVRRLTSIKTKQIS